METSNVQLLTAKLDLLRTHCVSIRIRLFEPFKFGDQSESLGPTHLRCRTIWDCLQSTHELHDAFRLVSAESIPSLTVISILHLALAIIKASRLLCVEDRAWDLNTVRTMYNFSGILQQLKCLKMQALVEVLGVK